MKEELTEYETKLLFLMENCGRWDGLFQSLTTGIPCVIIMALGYHFQSWMAIIAGVITYTGIRLWTVLQQDAMTPHIRSAINKLRMEPQEFRSAEPEERGPVD
ncbi:MAG: hypothetical protein JJU05_14900 [Verrucomicrobia bacterium]|nr:hypothetical protein [Verrucomicrobiota bacterium]MCH8527876.1 hypothetical protein [Kiritimatiellia bacterium]